MRPITLDPKAYPSPALAHPSRWWWRTEPADTFGWWRERTDGLFVGSDNPDGPMVWIAYTTRDPRSRVEIDREPWPTDGARGALEAILARVDAAHPLPRPPFRCGQEWAEWTWATLITNIHADRSPSPMVSPDAFLVAGPFAPWSPALAHPDRSPPT